MKLRYIVIDKKKLLYLKPVAHSTFIASSKDNSLKFFDLAIFELHFVSIYTRYRRKNLSYFLQ